VAVGDSDEQVEVAEGAPTLTANTAGEATQPASMPDLSHPPPEQAPQSDSVMLSQEGQWAAIGAIEEEPLEAALCPSVEGVAGSMPAAPESALLRMLRPAAPQAAAHGSCMLPNHMNTSHAGPLLSEARVLARLMELARGMRIPKTYIGYSAFVCFALSRECRLLSGRVEKERTCLTSLLLGRHSVAKRTFVWWTRYVADCSPQWRVAEHA